MCTRRIILAGDSANVLTHKSYFADPYLGLNQYPMNKVRHLDQVNSCLTRAGDAVDFYGERETTLLDTWDAPNRFPLANRDSTPQAATSSV